MVNELIQYVSKNRLFTTSDKLLLGISGGIDSVTLCDLMHKAGFNFSLAHCNFGLRGEESDGDEAFVRQLADNYNITLHVTRFETEWYASENNISIQMAARDLRYRWFESLLRSHGYKYIVIAHNNDDSLETFFVNLTRGTGIRGLTGISPLNGHVVRPLLFASRAQIEEYTAKNHLSWREDSSNSSDKYLRNKIRHQLIPFFEGMNPNFRKGLAQSIQRLNGTATYFDKEMLNMGNELIIKEKNFDSISIEKLLNQPSPCFLLSELLLRYGFSQSVSEEIFNAFDAIAGKQFYSATHRLVKDREYLIINHIKGETNTQFIIEQGGRQPEGMPVNLRIELCDWNYKIPDNPNVALFDATQVSWPLVLRHWQKGDYFIPLGMNGMKKLSDFFTDEKFSLPQKENTWLLTSGDRIMWIIGHRIDNRFKLTGATRKVIQVTLLN